MLKIGEFSKLSHLTVKALRFYEQEGLLMPASTDQWTGYRFYETSQLNDASKIKALRQLDLSIDEIKSIFSGADEKQILLKRLEILADEKSRIDTLMSSIKLILEDTRMKYHVTEKLIQKTLVYYSETVVGKYSDIMQWIPSLGEDCMKLNPNLKCAEPDYEFCEYPDFEFKETDIRVRFSQAVTAKGKESERIKFREIPETKVLSVYHKGPYTTIGEAYSFITNYAEQNGYKVCGLARECYIDGIWNKDSEDQWLTEIQLPIE